MGEWKVSTDKMPGVIHIALVGTFTAAEMDAMVLAHNRAIDGQKSKDYKIFVDMREMSPLNQDAAATFARAKRYSGAHRNFRGSAVWVAQAVVAMQHRRTSVAGGVMDSELISENEEQLLEHLRTVYRES